MYKITITLLLIYIIFRMYSVKEGFSGFHEVNTVLRFVQRAKEALSVFKSGIWGAVNKIQPKKHEEKCEKHFECHDKCLCEQKKCKCIPNV